MYLFEIIAASKEFKSGFSASSLTLSEIESTLKVRTYHVISFYLLTREDNYRNHYRIQNGYDPHQDIDSANLSTTWYASFLHKSLNEYLMIVPQLSQKRSKGSAKALYVF